MAIDIDHDALERAALAATQGEWREPVLALIDEVQRLREALAEIAVYGCGMLNQPAAMNGPEEAWLRRRIAEYERVARAALAGDRHD